MIRFPPETLLGIFSQTSVEQAESIRQTWERTSMYCVHCGADGAGNFCAACGQRQPNRSLTAERGAAQQLACEADDVCYEAVLLSVSRWTDSIQYQTVLNNPEARQRLAAAGQNAKQGITGDDLLEVFDAVSPIGFSLGKLTNAILPIYDKMGVKTDRQAEAIFDAPPGRILLATLCALAKSSMPIDSVGQDVNRCSLSAKIPSGLITNRGTLRFVISVEEHCVRVVIATTISGQWYDFGKSKRLADEMFADIHGDITHQLSGNAPKYRRVC